MWDYGSASPTNLVTAGEVWAQTNPGTPYAGQGTGIGPDYEDAFDSPYAIARAVEECWRREDDRYSRFQNRSDKAFALYNQEYDSTGSLDDWQHKTRYPYVWRATEKWAAALCSQIDKNSNWVEIESLAPHEQVIMNLVRTLILHITEGTDRSFRTAYRKALKQGILSGQMHMMPYYITGAGVPTKSDSQTLEDGQTEQDEFSAMSLGDFIPNPNPEEADENPFIPNPTKSRLVFEVLDSSSVRRDSSKNQEYIMWKTTISAGNLRDKASDFGYDLELVESAIRRNNSPLEEQAAQRQAETKEVVATGQGMPDLTLLHFEGTLEDRLMGKIIFKKKYCVVCNGILLSDPVPIPFWDKSLSIISAPFIEAPGTVYGRSMITESVDIFTMRNDMSNRITDFMTKVIEPPILVDEDQLHEEDSLRTSDVIAPGQIIKTKNSATAKGDPVRALQYGDLPASAWQWVQGLDMTIQQLTGEDETAGAPAIRRRASAQESQQRGVSSGMWPANIFEGLDSNLLTPVIAKSFLRTLQFFPDKDWKEFVTSRKHKILPKSDNSPPEVIAQWEKQLDDIASWDQKKRYLRLGGRFKFKVNLYSSATERGVLLEQIGFMTDRAAKDPNYAQSVNMPEIIRKQVSLIGLEPEDVLNKKVLPLPDPEDGVQGGLPPDPSQAPPPGAAGPSIPPPAAPPM